MARIIWQRSGLPWDEVCRRAAARRQWNERRRAQARRRRGEVWNLRLAWGQRRGVQRAIADRLEVSPVTICRDVAALRRMDLW